MSTCRYVVNVDGSLTRLKLPEKDMRAKAIVYLSRIIRYLEDLPPRQVRPPPSQTALCLPRPTALQHVHQCVQSLRCLPWRLVMGDYPSGRSRPQRRRWHVQVLYTRRRVQRGGSSSSRGTTATARPSPPPTPFQ
jgi:hypothetical protein